ncbi:uncharacterized protein LOC128232528 [Mya arenaria]|uniref:uncharacterized protein LOC128232528 n=1 Tax=Mya arenaria TaxID=6604 RepID=UPI0022E12EF2|nr:uncharacterized protein LOC128232528 [Mya arenaria]
MSEKWLLVVLIVGGTALVFLVCFPIDFCLYRRRKRLARMRKLEMFYTKSPTKIAPQRANMIMEGVWADNTGNGQQTAKSRALFGFQKILQILRRKKENANTDHEQFFNQSSTIENASSMNSLIHGSPPERNIWTEKSNLVKDEINREKGSSHKHPLHAAPRADPGLPEGMILDATSALGEHEGLVDQEPMLANYGALEQLHVKHSGETISLSHCPHNCFTIPVSRQCTCHVDHLNDGHPGREHQGSMVSEGGRFVQVKPLKLCTLSAENQIKMNTNLKQSAGPDVISVSSMVEESSLSDDVFQQEPSTTLASDLTKIAELHPNGFKRSFKGNLTRNSVTPVAHTNSIAPVTHTAVWELKRGPRSHGKSLSRKSRPASLTLEEDGETVAKWRREARAVTLQLAPRY